MADIEVFYLQDRESGLWVIWNHQHYLLAAHPSDVCMGCFVQANDLDALDGLAARVSTALGGRDIIGVPVTVPVIAWCQRLPIRR